MSIYTPIIIKLGLGILCLIIQINLMGKGNLAPTSAMDQVQNYVLGGIIGGVIYNESITVLQFVLVLIIWTLLVFILKFSKEHNHIVKRVVDGKPITLIHNGSVNVQECLRNGISANELMFKLRANGIYEVEKLKRVVLEQNGQLTIIESGDENIRYPIIVDGQVNADVLEIIGKDTDWLEFKISEQGFSKISEIYLGEYLSGRLNLYGYTK
ncbi:putative membrane protein [Enterobacteriaceae bacterium strain FGI 57]|nr:putative membrane protein [Enterobacteriaceae bacterium strain FGI 57]